jgi:3-oxoadipate enol-lactonase
VVALVHSLAMNRRFWDPVARRLAGRAALLTIDARGHGESGRGEAPFTVQRMADDLRDVMDHLGIERAVVGGASMGGCVALGFAGAHASRASGLALVDTTAWYGPAAPQEWEARAAKAMAEGLPSLVGFQTTRWFSDGFRAREPAVVQACIDVFLANDLQAYVESCRMLGAFDGRPLMAGLRLPTRVLVGDEDYAAPVAMAQALQAGIPGARLQVIPGARHLTPLEVPDVVAAAVLELCEEAGR